MRPATATQAPAPDITRHVGRTARVRYYGDDRIERVRVLIVAGTMDGGAAVAAWDAGRDPPRLVKVAAEDVIEFTLIETP